METGSILRDCQRKTTKEETRDGAKRKGEPMATILEFRSQSSRSVESTHHRDGVSAEIVLFPGIRYERWIEDAEPPAKQKKGGRRDRLELEDC